MKCHSTELTELSEAAELLETAAHPEVVIHRGCIIF